MNAKPKIAVVSDAIYPYFKGGKEKRIHEITTRLAARGYDVTIYTMHSWNGPRVIMEDGVRLHAISPRYPLYEGKRRSISQAVRFAFHCFALLFQKFDVIEVDHMPHLVLFSLKAVCVIRGKKMNVTWHEVWGEEYWEEYLGPGFKAWLASRIEKWSAQLPDVTVSVSEHTTEELRRVLGRKKPIVTVRNGLDMQHIESVAPASAGPDILFAGRLLSHKNVDVLIYAVAKLVEDGKPRISLWVVGEGPARASLEALVQQRGLGNNVKFLGFLDGQDELYRIMKASRVVALPSSREGFGIVLMEANACGIPVLTIDHPHNAGRALIDNGENGTVTKLDAEEIARGIETLLATRRPAEFYRRFAERYDWNRTTSEMQTIFTS